MHIVQSPEWGQFKTKMGTVSIRVGDVQYTKHKVPFSNNFYAYCPKVDPKVINWEDLKESLQKHDCIAINFDVPNSIKGTDEGEDAETLLKTKCKKSPKDTFAKSNVILDISKDEEEILKGMHKKHRYNIRYAEKQGVVIEEAKTEQDFNDFYSLLEETAQRQKYYIHSKTYYKNIWEMFKDQGISHILIARHEGVPLVAWMLFTYKGTLYYPYGASSNTGRNLMGSNLIAWEAIKLGKENGCNTFDMWGAAIDPDNKEDPYHGFTNFKLKFGGEHVTYIDSYDYVVNEALYTLFNTANNLRWKILNFIR
ncbi:peptidoglycan bridge formation glycyltransferase FemA/FemB family protein [candidate division WWE3 bacterium]|jgi:lipid II:glycine glycyltransferase (peptidoglycan interpeptide bridge formation enzyme)|nr:peptidoglycan bridge formation glycyltransferase FemA/FemB family protein [candidate division WWE3 bacterium]MBT7350335.1 peptidoglycan bridge formation glycyltransferase FemA/FemB family protein [candidate division WWE3 bacterium]